MTHPQRFRLMLSGSTPALAAVIGRPSVRKLGFEGRSLKSMLQRLNTAADGREFSQWINERFWQAQSLLHLDSAFATEDLLLIKDVLVKPEMQDALHGLADYLHNSDFFDEAPGKPEQVRLLMAELLAAYFKSATLPSPAKGALALLATMPMSTAGRAQCQGIDFWWLWKETDRPGLLARLLGPSALARIDQGVLDISACSLTLGEALWRDQHALRMPRPLTVWVPKALARDYEAVGKSLPAPASIVFVK